jgi:catechol 2,3-dioxygenase-like lactoylglutathione lyase family enzyme
MGTYPGRFFLCISVRDVERSLSFYERLGFEKVHGDQFQDWAIVEWEKFRLGLFQSKEEKNLLNFLDVSLENVLNSLKETGLSLKQDLKLDNDRVIASIMDPDGNVITFAGPGKNRIGSLECPRCGGVSEPTEKSFEFGVFQGESFHCESCKKSFTAYYRGDVLSHTTPRAQD